MKTLHKNLLSWYEQNGRHDLPWRNTDDVYHIYVSEIMLQQTQVNRVRDEYYFQFLERFPSMKALGKANLDEVFGMWSGLGYYRRAKNLHASAQVTSELPVTMEELQKLPGIGRYTASAICSFGYHQQVSVVDTNIKRVLIRLFGMLEANDKQVWNKADEFLNHKEPTAHNSALMDLGAMICLPKNPKCDVCPFALACKAKDNLDAYVKTTKKVYINKELHFALHAKNEKLALNKSTSGMYKDMLELPLLETIPPHAKKLGSFKHAVTKYRLDVSVYVLEELEGEYEWTNIAQLDSAPISSMTQKALKFLEGAS